MKILYISSFSPKINFSIFLSILCLGLIPSSLVGQNSWSFVYDYTQFHLWEEIYLTPIYNNNVLYSEGDIHIENEEVLFDDCGGRADKRVFRKLGAPLGDNWVLDFDFTPTAGGPHGVAHVLAGLTAGTDNPYNIVPQTVNAEFPTFYPTDQDGIFFEYLSSLYGAPSTYYLRVRVKDGTSYESPSTAIAMAPDNQVHYLRMERSGTQVTISVFSDAARTQLPNSKNITISGSVSGLNVLQHSNIPQGSYNRRLTAKVDNFKLSDPLLPCVRCEDVSLNLPTDQNYVVQKIARVPVQTEAEFQALSNSADIWTDVTYVDGLGRPLQVVSVTAAPNGGDLISYHQYDALGRETIVDLPYVDVLGDAGSFRDDGNGGVPMAAQRDFYDNTFPHIWQEDRNNPFSITQIEASPLNRITEQGMPGIDWQPELGSPGVQSSTEHTIVKEYLVNTGTEKAFKIGDGPGAFPYTYGAGTLKIIKTIDETGSYSEVVTDKGGRTLYERIQIEGNQYAYTQYIYDSFGRIKYTLQPEGWEIAKNSGLTPNVLNNFAFQFVYDDLGRTVEKKIPGADWVYMVYNELDQLVFIQDGNQRISPNGNSNENGKWSFIKYDALRRPIMKGIHHTFGIGSRSSLQSDVDAATALYEYRDGDNYLFKGYSNQSLPDLLDYAELHSVNHYDDYDFDLDGYPEGGWYTSSNEFPSQVPSSRNMGLITNVDILVLDKDSDMSEWLSTTTFYDKYRQEIKTQASSYHGGTSYSEYNFAGELLSNFNSNQGLHTFQSFSYGPRGRLLRTEHKILDGLNPDAQAEFHTLSEVHYDPLSQIAQKKIHYKSGEEFLQVEDYEYNIRGWLKTYNMPFGQPINGNSPDNDLFAMGLVYNYRGWASAIPEANLQFNGNVGFMAWQALATGDEIRTYKFEYDGLSRLKGAQYEEFNNTFSTIGETLGRYNLTDLDYDKNGNILSLTRMGKKADGTFNTQAPFSPTEMDDLTYTYSDGNQLYKVTDGGVPIYITER